MERIIIPGGFYFGYVILSGGLLFCRIEVNILKMREEATINERDGTSS